MVLKNVVTLVSPLEIYDPTFDIPKETDNCIDSAQLFCRGPYFFGFVTFCECLCASVNLPFHKRGPLQNQ